MADPGADLDRVALDLHPPAAAVTELAARHLAIERLAIELEPSRNALDDRDQPGPCDSPAVVNLKVTPPA